MSTPYLASLTTGARVTLLALSGLLAAASSSTSAPPGPATPANQGAPPPGAPDPASTNEVELQGSHLYRGPHPVHPDFGSGFCEQGDVHGEPYPPFEPELFARSDGVWIFIGDPGDFGHEGPVYWYANPHPLPEEYGGDWCHYPWPHRHHFELSGEGYDLVGGFLYFVGAFTDAFFRGMHHKRPFFRRHYRRSYLGGQLYRRHRPRYARVGPNRYRRLYPRQPGGRATFRPYRPGRADLTTRPGQRYHPGTQARDPSAGPGRRGPGLGRGQEGMGWQRRPGLGRGQEGMGWQRRPGQGTTRLGGLRLGSPLRRFHRAPRDRRGAIEGRRPGGEALHDVSRGRNRRGLPGGMVAPRGGDRAGPGRGASRSGSSKGSRSGASSRSGGSGSSGRSGGSSRSGSSGGGGSSRSRR